MFILCQSRECCIFPIVADGISRVRQRLRALSERHRAEGQLHESKSLTASVGGRARQVHVPAGDEARVAQGVERYRRWRRVRGEITEVDAEVLKLVDALGVAL